ncbi:patellin-4 [Canna indica]|uniref:Patellin-4 n=1 Tax=Canna indica TaxID=4628 RepID=A0AAQ3KU47_9LILI|nr:patellin-4 [Canna indica]
MSAELNPESVAHTPADAIETLLAVENDEKKTEEVDKEAKIERKENEPEKPPTAAPPVEEADKEVNIERKENGGAAAPPVEEADKEVNIERKESEPEEPPAAAPPVVEAENEHEEPPTAAPPVEEADKEVNIERKEDEPEELPTSGPPVEEADKEVNIEGKENKPEEPATAAPPVEKCSSNREESNFLAGLKESEKKALIEAPPADENDEKKTEKSAKDVSIEGKENKPEKTSKAAPPVEKCSSYREESNFLADLKEPEKKALIELRAKVEEAILENSLLNKNEDPNPKQKKEEIEAAAAIEKAASLKEKSVESAASEGKEDEKAEPEAREGEKAKLEQAADTKANEETLDEGKGDQPASENFKEESLASSEAEACDMEATLWGVPLLPSKGSEGTDVILLKFLRARDFKVKEAFEMLQNVLRWRKEFNIDTILEEESLGADIAAACYMDGVDREGHPVCYNISGVFHNDKLYLKTFGSEEGREKFTRWRVQMMEEGVGTLDFRPGGVTSLVQVTDLKNSPGPSKKELRTTMKLVVQLLQDNYPEFVAKNIFINVPFWYYAFNAVISPFLTQRTKSKFVFARPSKVSETLLNYIPAEAIPVRYGGLKRENDTEFPVEGGEVSELIVKSSSTETVEILAPKAGATLLWDLSVFGWEVTYREEFVPTDEASYTLVVRKTKKMGSDEEPIRNSFRNKEPGKIVLTIENNTYWKKRVVYRYKMK